ncbi:hypothetical protein [Legionella quateirensis]|uniref:hypothetical protein n=1 Tax=Legionella quateirensis TaxID=45072 RepID=UPI0007305F8B|nr:hypothetical protein [Legionella quateirensis]
MQAQHHIQEIPHCVRDDVFFKNFVILSEVKDLQMQAQHYVRDDVSFRNFVILSEAKDLQMQAWCCV